MSKIVQTPEQILEQLKTLYEKNKGVADDDLGYWILKDLHSLIYKVENGYPAT
jgi:hypothetical protein